MSQACIKDHRAMESLGHPKWLNGCAMCEIERLRACLSGDAECPCCQETHRCLDSCTFAEDSPDGHERMTAVRQLLAGACP